MATTRFQSSATGPDVPVSPATPLPVVSYTAAGAAAPIGTGADPLAVLGNVASGAVDSGAPVKIGAVVDTTRGVLTSGNRTDLKADIRGNLFAAVTGSSGTGADGVPNTIVQPYAANGGGAGLFAIVSYRWNGSLFDRDAKPNAVSRIASSAADTNPTSAKASAGNLFHVNGYNAKASVVWLKFYRKATAPTVGTDTPFLTLPLAPSAVFKFDFDSLYFSTGIAYGLTTDAADAGTTAVLAGDILGLNVAYS